MSKLVHCRPLRTAGEVFNHIKAALRDSTCAPPTSFLGCTKAQALHLARGETVKELIEKDKIHPAPLKQIGGVRPRGPITLSKPG
ncbi:hypothetical protein DPEC_G00182410 [Dallia pectoralis]|uniref:Uncharacterized protein n=1 Tax=Dallia pectoralis TaxID=75939 RepID=A0ACC2GAV1_DALPE|nr:hypothetical protein DPEC_G00182410 [Dallia pectoralis]